MRIRRIALGSGALSIGLVCLAGCQQLMHPPHRTTPMLGAGGPTPAITRAQEADMQIALGRAAEKRGDLEQATAAYREALKRDKGRADAYLRLAILNDRGGNFRESAELYRRAIEADPGNPDIYCDMGYSLYLQRRWAEAEMNLRQAIVRQPDHPRAHNNLGLVLAHNERTKEALEEFRKGGSSIPEAFGNLAFALTLDRRWKEAREQYKLALIADPSADAVKARLQELDALIAKEDSSREAGARDVRLTRASTATTRPVTPNPRRAR